MRPSEPRTSGFPWFARLETRVAATLALLVAGAMAVVFLVTTRVVSVQSRDRAAAELEVARGSFSNLVDERIAAAIGAAELVTQLPVFRAHLTDSQLAENRANVQAMADGYREQLHAQFAIVARPRGAWAADPGWPGAPAGAGSRLHGAIAAALAGSATGEIISQGDALFLTVSVPARFADEILGSLTLGYRLTNELAQQLARLAGCEVILISEGRVVATSLGSAPTDAVVLTAATTSPVTTLRPDLLRVSDRAYVTGVFPLGRPETGGDSGRLLLLSDWQPTQAFIDRLRSRFAWTGLVVLGLSLAGGLVFSRRISRPLKDIAVAASEIAAGNLQLVLPEDGTVESVAVARAFNGMSASLQVAHGKLVHDATHDPLTRLPNRALFMERLERAMIRRRRHPHYCFAVLFIDLDRFKHVNDSLGHSAGDELLILFAERLANAVRRDDAVARLTASADEHDASTLARFGGDEFVVLLDDIRDPIDAVRISERIQQVSAEAFGVAGEDVFATPSIGVAVASAAHHSAADLLRDADMAMYRAKQSGGGTFAVADAAMHEHAVNRLHLETELRHAIDRGEFRLRYQPIVSLGDRRVVGFEALVRWQHPERGLLCPVDFLAVADEVGLTPQIDEWVLREACRQGKEWIDANPDAKPPMLSVNLSPKCFAQASLVQQIADTLSTSGFPPSGLRLEITESTAIRDAERAKVVLAELRRMGVRVSIDDFGTGYSSLSYLQMFPVDVLKIDRSFVERLAPNTSESEIIQLILGLAKTLGLDVVAEGAETEAQVRYLEALGCGFGQGFFFDRPLEAADAWRRTGSVVQPEALRGRST